MKKEITKEKLKSPHGMVPRGAAVPPLGVHVSVAGGLETGFERAREAGCDCLQIFVKNQRQWRAPALTPEQVQRYRAAQRASGLDRVIAHASYLLNLAAPTAAARRASASALVDELERCAALGVESLVFHPGAYGTDTPEHGMERIAESLNEVARATSGCRTMILLETTAGQGTSIGWRFEHLAAIRGRLASPERVGVCLDTCHLFAAGYDVRTPESYRAVMDELERVLGASHVRCIHVNDSKKDLGSRVDRHEHIGRGRIGKSGFANFLHDPRWRTTPMILETPKGTNPRGQDWDKVNLRTLRGLIGP